MSLKNFLPLRREVTEHWIYKDSDYFKVWVDMLFKARFSEEPKKDIYEGSLYTINQSEFLFSRNTWSSRLNINPNKLYKLINLLIQEQMIEKVGKVGKSGATIYSIVNYQKYNNFNSEATTLIVDNTEFEDNSQQRNNSQATAFQQPSNSQATLKKNVKTDKSVKGDLYVSVFDHYINSELVKHKSLTADMKKAIDLAMKELSLDKDYLNRIIDRHSEKVKSTQNNGQYATKARTLAELFGQKKHKSVSLICTDYLDEVYGNQPQVKQDDTMARIEAALKRKEEREWYNSQS